MLHADYEMTILNVTDKAGRNLRLVRRYSDGIMLRDLVTLWVYDGAGKVVVKLPSHSLRDVFADHKPGDEVRVFGIEFAGFGFHKGWLLRNDDWLRIPPLHAHFLALGKSLHAHWLAYGLAVVVCTLGIVSHTADVRAAGTTVRWPGVWAHLALLWLLGNGMYGALATSLILWLSALIALPLVHGVQERFFVITVCVTIWLLPKMLALHTKLMLKLEELSTNSATKERTGS